ncbi:uncharacterized protein [Amphiura filiformis]|uniref:uncharacterized protein n=1 Tax=Amphiura filiformis TaxID=82378 RepID=UPI003B20F4FC
MKMKHPLSPIVVVLGLWIYVAVVQAVEFAEHPSSASGIEGATITLHCGVNTEFRPGVHRIYWAFYATPGAHTFLSVDRSIYSSISASKRTRYSIGGGIGPTQIDFDLIISNAQQEDNGMYECILYDPFTGQRVSTPESAKVVVIPPKAPNRGPICSILPLTPRPGVLATFTCYTHGGLPRPKLTWRKENAIMTSVLNSTEDAGLEIIQLKRYITNWDNNVTYTCTAEHPAMSENRNCTIKPFEVPVRVKVTPLQFVNVGQKAEFHCSATAIPAINRYKWLIGRGDKIDRITKSEGRYYLSSSGNFLRINDVTEQDDDLPVRCVARNALDLKGIGEGVLKVITPRPTANVGLNPTADTITTLGPKPGTEGRNGVNFIPGNGKPDIGRGGGPAVREDGVIFERLPERPFRPKPSTSFGIFTDNPNGRPTMKQRAYDKPQVTNQMHNNDLERALAPSGLNMTFLIGGATGSLLIVLIVFLALALVARRSNTSKSAAVKSARKASLRYSTGTLSKSDIFVLPVPSSEDEEKDATKPVSTDGIKTVRLISLEKAATLDKGKSHSSSQDLMSQLKGTLRSRSAYMSFYENEALTKTCGRLSSNSSDLSEGEIPRCDSAFCDDYKPGLSGSENALDDCADARFFKNKKTDVSKSAGNLVYVELDFSRAKDTSKVHYGDDKTHYAEIRLSRNLAL